MRIPNRLEFARDALTWGAPAIGIPALRYFQDDKENRNALFVRDASTYSVGAVSFWATQYGIRRLLDRMAGKEIQLKTPNFLHSVLGDKFPKQALNMPKELETIKFIAFAAALAANIAYAGIGAVRLSQWFKTAGQSSEATPQPSPEAGSLPPVASPVPQQTVQPVSPLLPRPVPQTPGLYFLA